MSSLSESPDKVIDRMLRQGEEVNEIVGVEEGRIAITRQRLISYAPQTGQDTKNFDQVELPNIDSVTVETSGDSGNFVRASRMAIYAVSALIGGIFLRSTGMLELSGLIDETPNLQSMGIGGIRSLINSLMNLMAAIDEILILGGLVFLLTSVILFYLYYSSRQTNLVIKVSGREPIKVPVTEEGGGQKAQEVREALKKV